MNPLNALINLAVADDLPSLLEIVRGCISVMESQGIHQWDDVYPTKSILHNDIETNALWVARIDGRIGGVITLDENQSKEYEQLSWRFGGCILVVHRLMVAPAYQNQKLAAYMMRFAEDYAADKGYNAIRLDAYIQNPYAVRLYRRLEYVQAGIVTFRKGAFYCFEKKINKEIRKFV